MRRRAGGGTRWLTILLVCSLTVDGLAQEKSSEREPRQLLTEAQELLKGQEKKEDAAHLILTRLVVDQLDDLSPKDLGLAYLYLGYIEDRAGRRDAAVSWFTKVVSLQGDGLDGIRRTAEKGMTDPVTTLTHLDGKRLPPSGRTGGSRAVPKVAGAQILRSPPPENGTPRMDLSEAERMADFEALGQAIDQWYSFFDHKKIDWEEVRTRYRPKVEAAQTTEEFYDVLNRFVRELKDNHSRFYNYKPKDCLPMFCPGLAVQWIVGKAVVNRVAPNSEASRAGVKPGWVIAAVDNSTVDDRIEQLRPLLPVSSSERHFQEFACRHLLCGPQGSQLTVSFLPPGKETSVQVELVRDQPVMEPYLEVGFPLKKGEYVWSGCHPCGYGYIRIVSFMGKEKVADEFDVALETLKDTDALILDIRNNTGGFGQGQRHIVGRFLDSRKTVGFSYVKNRPGRGGFSRRKASMLPTGDWQYTKPIALLTNVITGSASDLFARDLIGTGRPVTVGTTTHGNSTGTCVYAALPCGLVVRISSGYTTDIKGRIVEVNGNVPEIHAELTLEDVINGTDSVVERAVEALAGASKSARVIPLEGWLPRLVRESYDWIRNIDEDSQWITVGSGSIAPLVIDISDSFESDTTDISD